MSVDDRLRDGLARNAGTVVPSTERHLSAILARAHHRRRARWAWAATAAVACVAAALLVPSVLGTSRTDVAPVPPGSSSSSSASTDGTFPEGTYVVRARQATAKAAGFTDRQIRRAYGPDGSLNITLKFVGGRWTQLADYSPGLPERGDGGTYRVVGSTLVTISTSEGCPGCVGEMSWLFDGRRLTLKYTEPLDHTALERLMTEHTYLKID